MRRLARTPVIFLAIFSFSDDDTGFFGGGWGDGAGDDFPDGGEAGGAGLEAGPALDTFLLVDDMDEVSST